MSDRGGGAVTSASVTIVCVGCTVIESITVTDQSQLQSTVTVSRSSVAVGDG